MSEVAVREGMLDALSLLDQADAITPTSLDFPEGMSFEQALEYAWAAGFFDGEGTTSINYGSRVRRDGRRTPTFRLSLSQSGTDVVLQRFRRVVGEGKIYGPYDVGAERKLKWSWVAHGEAAARVLWRLLPWLSIEKRRQAAFVFVEWRWTPRLRRTR